MEKPDKFGNVREYDENGQMIPLFEPTPEEIKKRAADIREEWSEKEERKRRVTTPRGKVLNYQIPIVRVSELPPDYKDIADRDQGGPLKDS
jgi:hypothetical protein